jgi:hypothetical protein
MGNFNHLIDVFIGLGGLFGDTAPTGGLKLNPFLCEITFDLFPPESTASFMPGHHPSCSMGCRAEAQLFGLIGSR